MIHNRILRERILRPVRRLLPTFSLLLFFAACATPPPDPIHDPPPENISLGEASRNLSIYIGRTVRWGGTVAAVENRPTETWLEVVARPLDNNGRPRTGDESLGRFMARVEGFLDPAVYAAGRQVTVAGTIEKTFSRRVGEYPYTYVVVKADTTKLWEPLAQRPGYYRDPFYDPFYDPFWPHRIYPWYAPYPFYPGW
jgi:outer membrane lipoprotein